MPKAVALALYLLAMVALIVALDVTLLRDRFAARLIVNVAIVALFAGAYVLVSRRT